MKTKSFLLLLFISISVLASSQSETKKSNFKFGPKFGMDLNADWNNMPTGDDISGTMKENYQFGAFVQIGRRLYLQPEVLYAIQNVDNNGVNEVIESLRIPAHIGLKLIDIGLLSLHITGGAQYTLPLNSTTSTPFDINDLEYQFGAGVNILGFITTDIRYTFAKDATFGEQLTNFTENGGLVNITVGLRL